MAKHKKTPYAGRDHLTLVLIAGATKAGVHVDHRKEQDRKACREKVRREDW